MDVKNFKNRRLSLTCVVVMGLVLVPASIQAMNATIGFATYTRKTVEEPLHVIGGLTATELTAPAINITGPTTLTNSKIGSATIIGPLTARDTHFNDSVNLEGGLTATGSTFESALDIKLGFGESITLTDTRSKDITVILKGSSNAAGQQTSTTYYSSTKRIPQATAMVTLRGNTVVDGNLTFIGGTGTVHVDTTAKITGKIIHGNEEDQDKE